MNIESEIVTRTSGVNCSLTFKYDSKIIKFFFKYPNDTKGEIEITDKYDEYIYLGVGNKEQYLNLCKLIKEINYENKTN